jgi:four helix bundle protein
VCEADAGLTSKEFAQFCNIARREALETRFWLRLCRDEAILHGENVDRAFNEVDELGRILTTIVRKTRNE